MYNMLNKNIYTVKQKSAYGIIVVNKNLKFIVIILKPCNYVPYGLLFVSLYKLQD